MARARNIKPALFKNEVLGVADPMLTLLFEGLWLLADKAGRLEDRPLRIKGELFPYRDGVDIEGLLSWLAREDFIVRYTVSGKRYIQVQNFDKHQNPHRNEPESIIPSASEGCISTDFGGTASAKLGSARADSLIPDSGSLIPDPLDTPKPPSSAPTGDALFPKFWKLYPNKKGKAAAEKAWAKLKVNDELFALIAQGLAKQCVTSAWMKDGGQFIPHPATWLNGKRWEDEVESPAGNVHHLPTSRHHGFAERDYTTGLRQREDGSYAL